MFKIKPFGNVSAINSSLPPSPNVKTFLQRGVALIILTATSSVTMLAHEQLRLVREFKGYAWGYFPPDNRRLVLLDNDRLSIIEAHSGNSVCTRSAEDRGFTSAAVSPKGDLLAVNHHKYDQSRQILWEQLLLVNARDCKIVRKLDPVVTSRIGRRLSFSSDGKYLAASADGPQLWDAATGRLVFDGHAPEGRHTEDVQITADGRYLLSYDVGFPESNGILNVIDVATGTSRAVFSGEVTSFFATRDSRTLGIIAADRPGVLALRLIDLGDGRQVSKQVGPEIQDLSAISPNGEYMATGVRGTFNLIRLSDGVRVDTAVHYKRSLADDLRGELDMIVELRSLDFSADGRMLLTGGENGSVKLWAIDK